MAFDILSQKSKFSLAETVGSKFLALSNKTKKTAFTEIADRVRQDQESMYRKMAGI